MAMYKKLATECAAKEGSSKADVDEAIAKQSPSTHLGKCIHACIGETTGSVCKQWIVESLNK